MTNQLKDKVVAITGSTRGFGFVAAQEILKAGATVIISGRSNDALTQALNGLKPFGNASGWTCDVRDEKQVYALARQEVDFVLDEFFNFFSRRLTHILQRFSL